ncbi:hypothetical protein GX411_05340 [Candidatus Fermentibacteria bacterium]|nr:hypothetical protein [Candidatus Fermentibacteria bacterium]
MSRFKLSLAAFVIFALACGTPPPPPVTLTAPAEIEIGSAFEVTWAGPDSSDDYITIVPSGAPEGEWTDYEYTSTGNPISLTAPFKPGSYEIRYATERTEPDSTIGRITLTVKDVESGITAPAEAVSGAPFEVSWTGPEGSGGVYVVMVPQGTPEGEWAGYEWHYTSMGNPLTFTAPGEPGTWEVRLSTGSFDFPADSTLARCSISIVGSEVTLDAPETAAAGSSIAIGWTGPGLDGHYITIVPSGASEGDWNEYAYTSEGNPVMLTAPAEPGEYEIRYAAEGSDTDVTLARRPITIE